MEIAGFNIQLALLEHKQPMGGENSTEIIEDSQYDNRPSIFVTDAPITRLVSYRLLKRTFDITVAILGIVGLFPFLFVIGIINKFMSNGPVFYIYDEIGRNGKKFRCYKFRTMVQYAEKLVEKYLYMNEMEGPVFKIRNDPRITQFGRFLRKYSIDEFPQLWCILKGDMSLVGPRPALPREWIKYEPWQRRRLSVTPGITGMWQAYGRNQVSDFNKWVTMDLEYIDNWSIWLDIKILLQTIMVVLRGTGI